MNDDLANTSRRLDHLLATGKSLPRAIPVHVRIVRPAGPRACGVCGAADCANSACFRALLAAEENLAFKQRLAHHASAAVRAAGTRQNGHAAR